MIGKKFSTVFLVLIAGMFFVQPADARGLDLNRIDIIIGLGRHEPRHHFHHEPPPPPPPHAHHRRPPRGHYAREHREEFERRGPDGRVVERITRIETRERPDGHERHQRHERHERRH